MSVRTLTRDETMSGKVIDFTGMHGGAEIWGEDIGLEICMFCGRLGKPVEDWSTTVHKLKGDWTGEITVLDACKAPRKVMKELKKIKKLVDRRQTPHASNYSPQAWGVAKARGWCK